jgi:hypothetical protein
MTNIQTEEINHCLHYLSAAVLQWCATFCEGSPESIFAEEFAVVCTYSHELSTLQFRSTVLQADRKSPSISVG